MTKPVLMVAGGGTGGHVLAGIAVADAWRAKYGADCPVVFVGAAGKIEEKLVPRAGYPLHLLKLGSLNRASLRQKLKTYLQLPFSLLKSLALILQFRPSAVLGVGGYASGPLVLVARFFTRTAILEQNSVAGFTNRILGRWAHLVFSAFPGVEREFGVGRVRVTGNPIRSAMKLLPSAPRDPFTIFIFGGSQGALPMNSIVIDALPLLADLAPRLRFIHQTGEKDYDRVVAAHVAAGYTSRVEKFLYDMPECYAQASLVICRAGSGTMSELAAVGRAAVLVPFPQASDNHQEANARVFSEAGAAWLLRQQEAKGEDLARLIREAIASPSKLDAMEKNVTRFYKPNAALDIVQALL